MVGVAEPFRPSDRPTDGGRDTGPRSRAGARAGARACMHARTHGTALCCGGRGGPGFHVAAPGPAGGVRRTQIPRDRLRLCYSQSRVAPPEGGGRWRLAPSTAGRGRNRMHAHALLIGLLARPARVHGLAHGGVCRGCPLHRARMLAGRCTGQFLHTPTCLLNSDLLTGDHPYRC